MEMNKFMIKKEKIMAATVYPMMAINILSTLKVEATHLWVQIIIIKMRPRIRNKIKCMMLKTMKKRRMMMMMKKRKKRMVKVKKSSKKSNMLMRLSKPIKRSESRKSRSIRAQSRKGQNSYWIPQKY